MKKLWAFLLAMAMMISVTACGGDDNKKKNDGVSSAPTVVVPFEDDENGNVVSFDDGEDDTPSTTGTTTTTKPVTTTTSAPQPDNKYKVVSKTYTSSNGKATIEYPQISGLYDSKMEAFYNELFKSDIKEYETGLDGAIQDKETLELTYKVTLKTKDTLCIVVYGDAYWEGAAHPYGYAYAYNIDLKTGSTFVPSAGVDAAKVANNLVNGKGFDVVSGASKTELVEFYAGCDENAIAESIVETNVLTVSKNKKGEYVTSGNIGCRSYLDGNSDTILIMDVAHAVGDYAEIEIN